MPPVPCWWRENRKKSRASLRQVQDKSETLLRLAPDVLFSFQDEEWQNAETQSESPLMKREWLSIKKCARSRIEQHERL